MGRNDNRQSQKMRQKNGQRRKKARIARKASKVKADRKKR